MKRPEKKTGRAKCFGGGTILSLKARNYNQAYNAWEAYHEQEKKRLEEINKELLGALNEFKTFYLTLAHMNPERFIELQRSFPSALINRMEQAKAKAEATEEKCPNCNKPLTEKEKKDGICYTCYGEEHNA